MKKYLLFILAVFYILAEPDVFSNNMEVERQIAFSNYSSCTNDICLIQVELNRKDGSVLGENPKLKLLSDNAQVLANNCSNFNCMVMLKTDNNTQQFEFELADGSVKELVSDDYENSNF